MNFPKDNTPEKDTLKALFEAREAQFQENLYKGWAMAERDATYDAIKEIAIAMLQHGITISVIENGQFASSVVTKAIAIHEQIREYSDKQKPGTNQCKTTTPTE